jgi:hypothetical protein
MRIHSTLSIVTAALGGLLCFSSLASTQSPCGVPATVESVGNSCGLTLGGTPPVLGGRELLSMRSNLGNSLGWVLMTPAGAPASTFAGCNVFLDLGAVTSIAAFTTDVGGDATVDVAVPSRVQLCGRQFMVQAFISSPAGPLSFGALSNGLKFTIGS